MEKYRGGRIGISWNKVLILPDANYDNIDGFAIGDTDNPQWHWSIKGVIVVAPKRILFVPPGQRRTQYEIDRAKLRYSYSQYQQSKVNVKEGESVLFDFTAKFDAGEKMIDNLLLVRYDSIVAVKRNDRWIPLNGYLLVKIIEGEALQEVAEGVFFNPLDVRKHGYAEVLEVGSPCNYFGGELYDNSRGLKPGCLITYDKNKAVRLELDAHDKAKICKIHRKDVLIWMPKN